MAAPPSPGTSGTVAKSKSFASRLLGWLVKLGILVVALVVVYVWGVLNWSYSVGDRAGYLQKFSQKGWICKTWEGELAMVTMPGAVTEKFAFTVRDDAVAAELRKAMSQRVALQYEEHVGVPTSCFGDTSYYVTGVTVSDEPPIVAPAERPAAPVEKAASSETAAPGEAAATGESTTDKPASGK